MTCLISCSRCKVGFDLDDAGTGAIYLIPLNKIPFCANCIDDIVYEYLEREDVL